METNAIKMLVFFKFSSGIPCGTKTGKVGCGMSVTLCGKCVRSAILGNIMYGMIGEADFSRGELKQGAVDTKSKFRMSVDPYDKAAYSLGYSIAHPVYVDGTRAHPKVPKPKTIGYFCSKFNKLLLRLKDGIREGDGKGSYNDLSTCKACPKKTK